MKKMMALLLAAVMICVLFPPAAFAAGDTFIDAASGLKFLVLTESAGGAPGTVRVVENGYTGATYTVPASVTNGSNRYAVTEIGIVAFYKCANLSSIIISEGVTSIESTAFSGCTKLSSVTLPDGLESIGSDAFDNCTSLTAITIPSSVTGIGSSAFWKCAKLSSVILQDGLESIGSGAFDACVGLTAITIPSSVTEIGAYAFRRASSLRVTLEAGSRLTSIGIGAYLLRTELFGVDAAVTTYNAIGAAETVDMLIAGNQYRIFPSLPTGGTLTGLCMQKVTEPLSAPPDAISSDFTKGPNLGPLSYSFIAPADPVTIYAAATNSGAGTAPQITTASLPDGQVSALRCKSCRHRHSAHHLQRSLRRSAGRTGA